MLSAIIISTTDLFFICKLPTSSPDAVMWKLMQPATYKLPTDLSPVVGAYEHALFALHPKSHYLVGKGWWLFLLLGYYMPRVVTEWIVRRLPGSGRPVPKALQQHKEKLY